MPSPFGPFLQQVSNPFDSQVTQLLNAILDDVRNGGEEGFRKAHERLRKALRDASYNPSLDEALNSGNGSYKP